MAHATDTSSHGSALTARIGAMLVAMRQAYARHRIFVRTRRELQALTTEELNDLGLSRSMITRLAAEAAYGTRT